ncbi:MAG: hypothetical protein IVW57_05565 [Ktedonobacterales bacterium]|nr:hypothetical protein [Ktedonobacterales bacterium]
MAENSWGHGGPVQPETGIGQVLAGYAARGGHLLGARRWPDNPLTMTHARWHGPDGFILDAVRRPNDDEVISPEEREVWVQLALHCSMAVAPSDRPNEAPWLAIEIEPARVSELVRLLQRARANAWSGGPTSGSPYAGSPAHYPSAGPPASEAPRSPYHPGAMGTAAPRSRPLRSHIRSLPSTSDPFDGRTSLPSEADAWTGNWQRGALETPEVSLLPCVEVELPMLLGDPAAADSIRDFTRDVAMNFSRACRGIPQVRETRGWMYGNRLVLAARMAVAQGTRAPTRAEMEGAANILADALAQRTLPYTRLGFADAGAWAQGSILPA